LGEQLLQTEKNGARTTVLAPLCLQSAGADLRSFSFEIMVDINLGYKPHSILKKIHRLVEKGKVDTLMIGTHKIGSKWKMTNASDSFDVVYAGGELAKASISVTLKEY